MGRTNKMINKYKNANRDLKQYKVSRVKSATSSNGKPYTVFNIADAKQINNQWVYDNYGVFSWQPELSLKEGDKIEILDIYALEVKEDEYNGQKSIKKTIFADVRVAGDQKPKDVQVYDSPAGESNEDIFPF